MQILAEAATDGWGLQTTSRISDYAISVAPFGLYPFVTAGLAAFAYLSFAWGRPIHSETLLVSGTLFAVSLVGAAISGHFAKEQIYLDGWRSGTPQAWILHSSVAMFLGWIGAESLKRRRQAEQAEDGDTSQRPC